MKKRHDPDCKHHDTDRVGAFEIICYDCMMIMNWQKALETGAADWKPLVEKDA